MRMTVRGVKRVVAKGHVYYYHRKTGERLKAEFGTAAFLDEVEALNRRGQDRPPPLPGTVGALFLAYMGSKEFKLLAERTKADYRLVLGRLAAIYQIDVGKITTPFLLKVRDKAFDRHGWRFANYTVSVLQAAWKWAKPHDYAKTNPTLELERLRRPHDMPRKNRAWTDREVDIVLEAAPRGLKEAIALAVFAGLRRGDAIRLKWNARKGGWLTLTQRKTDEVVEIPEHRRLRGILDAADKTGIYIVTRRRKSKTKNAVRDSDFTEKGFQASFFKLVRQLRDAGKVGPGLSFHGLRVTAATNLADAGCDPKTIAAVTGHRTTAMVEHYTRGADRRRRAKAGITRLERARNAKRKTGTDGSGKPSGA